jgi:hypothetical protein
MTVAASLCKSCGSSNLIDLDEEISIHRWYSDGFTKLPKVVSPTVLVCLDCGLMQWKLTPTELRLIQNLRAAFN